MRSSSNLIIYLSLSHLIKSAFIDDFSLYKNQHKEILIRAADGRNRFNFVIGPQHENEKFNTKSFKVKRDQFRNIVPSGRTISESGRLANPRFSKYQLRLIHNITQILDNLLYGYDNRLRPGYGRNPAIVNVGIMIRSMGSISELNMDFTMSMYFRQRWRDERLAFEGPVTILPVSIKILEQIWKPDTYFHNGKESYVHSLTVPNRFLRIDKNGSILYSTRLTVKARCPMNLADFPMDQQYCPLVLGSFGYDTRDVLYKWRATNPVTLSEGLTFSQFELINIKAEEIQHLTPLRNSSMLGVRFHFRRHIGYFLLQIYLPCILIVILSWVSFWINREATADRVGLSITSVLALSAFFLDARSDLPKSPYPTRLDKFVFVCLFYVSATLLEFAGVHYYTKFGTGELFLSELLDVKLGYLPGVTSGRKSSQHRPQTKRFNVEARNSTLRRRAKQTSTDSVSGRNDAGIPHDVDERIETLSNHTKTQNHLEKEHALKGQNPMLNRESMGRNSRNELVNLSLKSKEAFEGQYEKKGNRIPGHALWRSLLRILRMLLNCHLNILTKLWGCVAGKPKWGVHDKLTKNPNLTEGEMMTNSVSVLDRFSKILFPLTFLVYNYFYWKPYFKPILSDSGGFYL